MNFEQRTKLRQIDYPASWPSPDPKRPKSIQTRITAREKFDLYHRNTTTRELASSLGCSETYLSHLFPGKCPVRDRQELLKVRKEFQIEVAKNVLLGLYTAKHAMVIASVSYTTMLRKVQKAKQVYPHLVQAYRDSLKSQRQQIAASARSQKAPNVPAR